MKKVVYVGVADAVEIEHPVGAWVVCRRGEPVELPNRLADRLLEQEIWAAHVEPAPVVKGAGDAA